MAATSARYFEARARVYRRTWRGTVISSFLNPLMYLVAMGLGLGTLVDAGTGIETIGGFSYVEFLAPGLLVSTMMTSAAGDSAWPVMAGFKWRKSYHAVLASPLSITDIVVGHLAFAGARLAFIGVVFVLISALFGAMPLGWGLVAVAPAVLTGLAFSASVMAFTATLNTDSGLSNLFRYGIVPMFLFSGVFFPITQLPGWLQPVAYATPLWNGVELARSLTLHIDSTFPAGLHVAYLIAWVAIGAALAVRYLTRKLVV